MGASGLLLVNVCYLAFGVGLLALVAPGLPTGGVGGRLGLAYAVGLAAGGMLAAQLALAGLSLGPIALGVLSVATLFAGGIRTARRHGFTRESAGDGTPWIWRLVGGVALLQTGLLLAVAGSAFAVRPIVEWDGWDLWALKARALYELGGVANPVFEGHAYAQHMQDYPLFLPALAATGYHALGHVDERLVHLQLLGVAVAFTGGLWGLLRPRVRPEILGLTLFAIVAAPGVLDSLAAFYADAPLALLTGLGVAALGRWLVDRDTRVLPLAALFLAAAALTKNEGAVVAGAALVAALVVARGSRKLVVGAAAGVLVPLVPWRVFVAAHHIEDPALAAHDLGPARLARHADRIGTAAGRLLRELVYGPHGLLVALAAVALLAAWLAGLRRLTAFTLGWLTLSFAAFVVVYWASPLPLDWYLATSAPRIVLSLVVGAAALAPLGAGALWEWMLADHRRPGLDTEPLPASETP